MAKVFAREIAHIGLGNNRELKIEKGELYDDDDPIVIGYPSLFAPVAESTDARVNSLEQQIAELTAALAAKDIKPAKKTTAAAAKEVKEDVI